MRRAGILAAALALALLTACAAVPASASGPQRYEATWVDVFDTVTTVVGYADSEAGFTQQADALHETLREYHELYDIYNEYDGVNNLKTVNDRAGEAPVEVDARIIDLLVFARELCEATGGKTNAAMGAVTSLWHDARAAAENDANLEGTPPAADEIAGALGHISFDAVVIDEAASTVFLTDAAQSLDVGAVAKGYALERAAESLSGSWLVSVGGNVRAVGEKPDGSAWAVGVQDPDGGDYAAVVEVRDLSVVTSGDYQRYFVSDGVRYHHIIDPETGYPSGQYRSVTIVCRDSGVADALSTALFDMPREDGEALCKAYDAEAMWILSDGSREYTDGFSAMLRD